MSKKSMPDAPPAPDIDEMLETQARLNRTNSANPYGTSQWSQGPDGTYTQTSQFSADIQPVWDAQLAHVARGTPQFNYGTNPGAEMYGRLGMSAPSSTGGGLSYDNPITTMQRPPMAQVPTGQSGGNSQIQQPPPRHGGGGGRQKPQGQLPPGMADFLRTQGLG